MNKNKKSADEQKRKKNLLEIRQGQVGTSPQIPFDYTGTDSFEAEDEDALPPYIDENGEIKNAQRTTYGQGVPPFQEPVFEVHMHRVKGKNQKSKNKNQKRKGNE